MSEEGRYIKGGGGSHWVGCEETHWDCKIARLEKENARLKKAVEEAVSLIKNITDDSQWFYADKWLKEYGKENNG